MTKLELRNVLEYGGIIPAYEIFKPIHENVVYSDVPNSPQIIRRMAIKNVKEFDEFLKKSNIFFIFLDGNPDNIVGYIILDVFESGEAKIQEIVIKQEFRMQGFGRRAVKTLIEELKKDKTIKYVRIFSATMATDDFWSACNFRYLYGDTYEYALT